jgi:hypothetical protein
LEGRQTDSRWEYLYFFGAATLGAVASAIVPLAFFEAGASVGTLASAVARTFLFGGILCLFGGILCKICPKKVVLLRYLYNRKEGRNKFPFEVYVRDVREISLGGASGTENLTGHLSLLLLSRVVVDGS